MLSSRPFTCMSLWKGLKENFNTSKTAEEPLQRSQELLEHETQAGKINFSSLYEGTVKR